MIIKSKKTGKESCVTIEEWDKLKEIGIQNKYTIIDKTDMHKSVTSNINIKIQEFMPTKKNDVEIAEGEKMKTNKQKYDRKRTITESVGEDSKQA